jgi:tyrosine-protein phosphatase non-receptor type 23
VICCTSTLDNSNCSNCAFPRFACRFLGKFACHISHRVPAHRRCRNDAFTAKQISQLSLAYEKASVIFNIASSLANLAATQNRSSPEGLKRAFNYFRCSAGMFLYINDNFLHAPSTDLSKEVIKVLVGLMCAQATEIFVERMIEEHKGAGLKARICAQAAFLYTGLIEDTREFVNKGIFDRPWSLLIQVCRDSRLPGSQR